MRRCAVEQRHHLVVAERQQMHRELLDLVVLKGQLEELAVLRYLTAPDVAERGERRLVVQTDIRRVRQSMV